jgi:hypothetical protein
MTKKLIDTATPQITEPTRTAEEMVTTANELIPKIKASPNFASAPDVQTAVAAWDTANSNLDTNNKAKAKARTDLDTAETNEPPLKRRWAVRKEALLVAIKTVGDGSKDTVQSFNVAVEQKKPRAQATVPVDLRPYKRQKPTYASVRWDPAPGAHGYLLQHCTNPGDPTTISPAISCRQARFSLGGLTAGTTVYFRVLACDESLPNGQTAHSAWVPVLVVA